MGLQKVRRGNVPSAHGCDAIFGAAWGDFPNLLQPNDGLIHLFTKPQNLKRMTI